MARVLCAAVLALHLCALCVLCGGRRRLRHSDQKTGLLARWRMAGDAARFHTLHLDGAELTERAENAIKFLCDMFAARLYHCGKPF